MAGMNTWNEKIIAEFRTNDGRVGGPFQGAPLTLIHHQGRASGHEYVSPVMYLAHESDAAIIYVFGSKGGAPTHPDWYYNVVSADRAQVEVGTDTFPVTVSEIKGAERDRIFAEQARRYPGFADYARKTAGIRTIPVLMLRRTSH